MFNPLFRSYLPGFRAGPDGIPVFDTDDNGLSPSANASLDDTFPGSVAQPSPDSAQTRSPPRINFRLPGAEGWVLSAPLAGSPGFRVSPQNDVLGFKIRPQDDAPGFNVDESGVQDQETTWSYEPPPGSVTPQDPNAAQTATPPSDADDSTLPAPSPLPAWPYQLGTMLPPRLPTEFDPRTPRRIENKSLPSIRPATVPGAARQLSTEPQQPPDIGIRSSPATTQNTNFQQAGPQAMRNAWLPPQTVGQPYTQTKGGELQYPWIVPIARQAAGVSPILSARPLADSNFLLANAGDAAIQQMQQQGPLPPIKRTQQQFPASPPGMGQVNTPPALHTHEKPGTNVAAAERQPEQELSQYIEECRRAAADLAQELARVATRFGSRVYTDTILKIGSDIARLAERFANEPDETAASLANSFPQTRVEGEFFAGFAAVFTILKNAVRGGEFERDVLKALEAAKNKVKIEVEGVGRSIPDILNKGMREIKSGVEIDSSQQLRTHYAWAKEHSVPFNLIVGPATRRVSDSVKKLVSDTGGTIQRFDPATGSFTPFQ